jgi:tetratricopeptide (TPR) repeat protein
MAMGLSAGSLAIAHPEIELQIAAVSARLADRPTDPVLLLQRGELHRIHADWAAAEADFRRAAAAGAGAIVDFHVGRMKLEAGRLDEAAVALDRFLDREPSHAPALIARAETRVALGRPLEAASDFSRALAVTSRPEPAYYLGRARALAAAGSEHLDEAIRGLDEGLERLGHPVTLDLEAVELELGAGRYDAAIARIDRIAAASARREAWLVRRGQILEQAGRVPQARQAYQLALESIHTLPASRRWNRAVQKLEAQATDAVARLAAEP